MNKTYLRFNLNQIINIEELMYVLNFANVDYFISKKNIININDINIEEFIKKYNIKNFKIN